MSRAYIILQENDPKNTDDTTSSRREKRKVFDCPVHLLKRSPKGETPRNKEELIEAVVKAWKRARKRNYAHNQTIQKNKKKKHNAAGTTTRDQFLHTNK